MIDFIREVWHRFWLATPKFFVKLQVLSSIMFAAGTYFRTHDIDFELFGMSVVSILIGAGVFGVIGNQFMVKDYQKLQDKL